MSERKRETPKKIKGVKVLESYFLRVDYIELT